LSTINHYLTRRDFLNLSGLCLAGLVLPPSLLQSSPPPEQQGRVAEAKAIVYSRPSLEAPQVKTYWKDMVLPISEATVGEGPPEHNRIWYRIGNEGYTHSGAIQPVQTRLNPVVSDIPEGGALAEVTVPYTDAHWRPGKEHPFAYRFYYQTTYWVTRLVQDDRAEPWYRIADDKWDLVFYAPATHLRLVPKEELAPLSPGLRPEEKRLEVRLRQQLVIAYERNQPIFMARAATGAEFSNGKFYTPAGRHMTFHKRPSRHMAAGDLASNGYDLPGVPWICYITEKGVAFHGTYWHNDFGRPRSHGCINLTPAAAKWIFRWTQPVALPGIQDVYENYGTRVDIVE
jgi:hypothetical protein